MGELPGHFVIEHCPPSFASTHILSALAAGKIPSLL
jgi:hypothetical protein